MNTATPRDGFDVGDVTDDFKLVSRIPSVYISSAYIVSTPMIIEFCDLKVLLKHPQTVADLPTPQYTKQKLQSAL